MPIVSHTIEFTTQPNGATSNVLRMYDQDGREYTQTFWLPAGADTATVIQNMKAQLDEQLKQDEFNAIVGL